MKKPKPEMTLRRPDGAMAAAGRTSVGGRWLFLETGERPLGADGAIGADSTRWGAWAACAVFSTVTGPRVGARSAVESLAGPAAAAAAVGPAVELAEKVATGASLDSEEIAGEAQPSDSDRLAAETAASSPNETGDPETDGSTRGVGTPMLTMGEGVRGVRLGSTAAFPGLLAAAAAGIGDFSGLLVA
jgi:hypothetical protein